LDKTKGDKQKEEGMKRVLENQSGDWKSTYDAIANWYVIEYLEPNATFMAEEIHYILEENKITPTVSQGYSSAFGSRLRAWMRAKLVKRISYAKSAVPGNHSRVAAVYQKLF